MIGSLASRPPSPTRAAAGEAARWPGRPLNRRQPLLRRGIAIAVLSLVALIGAAAPAAAVVPGVNWPVQSLGDRGTDVLTIQRLLRVRLSVPPVVSPLPPADGLFQASTVAAVKTWQTRRGLPATGIVDATSWTALILPLHTGARGEAALALQVELREKRHATMAVDGTFSTTTKTAVLAFQKHMGLPVTGLVNAATWHALVGHFELPRFSSTQLCDYSVGNGAANWGMAEAVDTLEAVGRSMVASGYGRIPVGDLSLEHPGNIPGHATHERGLDIDIRMLRTANDQCTWGTRWSYTTYDRAATRAMIKKFRALAPGHIKLIYFNDPVLIREGLTTWYAGHDDHIHVRFCERIHPIAIYDC